MVENAVWIKPKHQIWETAASLTVTGRPSFAFDPAREIVYIVTADTLYSFTARGLKLFAQPLAAAHTNLLPGNQSIVDAGTGTLYNYYPDQKEIASYDTTRHQWNNSFVKGDVTEYWQANSFITKNKYHSALQPANRRLGYPAAPGRFFCAAVYVGAWPYALHRYRLYYWRVWQQGRRPDAEPALFL
jgi:hypothetical protein